MKFLFFTGDGLAIFYRRLERGTFEVPTASDTDAKGIELRRRATLARAEALADEKLPKPGIDLGSAWRQVVVSQLLLHYSTVVYRRCRRIGDLVIADFDGLVRAGFRFFGQERLLLLQKELCCK